jgi:hypothetical protein
MNKAVESRNDEETMQLHGFCLRVNAGANRFTDYSQTLQIQLDDQN